MEFRVKPELPCPVEFCAGSPLPDGPVDLRVSIPGYIDSGFAIARKDAVSQASRAKKSRDRFDCLGSFWTLNGLKSFWLRPSA